MEYNKAVIAIGALGKRQTPAGNLPCPDTDTADSIDVPSDNDYASSAGDDEESSGLSLLSELPSPTPDSLPLESTIIEKDVNEPTSGSLYPSLDPTSINAPTGLGRFAQRLVFWNRKQPPAIPNDTVFTRNPPPPAKADAMDALAPIPQSRHQMPSSFGSTAKPLSAKSVPSKEMQHSELEPKILRETVRILSREMYLAYDFGEF